MSGTEDDSPGQLRRHQSWWRQRVDALLDQPLGLALAIFFSIAALTLFVVYPLPTRAHVVLSLLAVAVGLITAARFPHMRLVVVFLSLAASLRYIIFRGTETLALGSTFDTATSVLLYIAELYALVTLVSGYFQTAIVRRNTPIPLDLPADQLPSVDIFIPTYNEPEDVLRPTILGALAIDYEKKHVFVLDDGRREWVRDLCLELGCGYFDRPDNKGAKAGNVNAALPRSNSDLIAFFDADHIPVRAFLKATVGFFLENQRLALVQTPHHFYNPDPFLRNLYLEGIVPPEQHLFYHGIQLGNDFWNSAFFCGSCAVLRRSALMQVGGFSQQTVTEDAHTALQLHSRGWDSLYLDIPLAAGLATETYAFHIGQRVRWARGMAQIVRVDNPLFKRGLSLAQRLNYFNAAWYFFFGLPRLIFLVTPALYLLFDLHPLDANVREVLIYAIPHLVLASLGSVSMNRNVRHSLWPEVYEVAIAPYTAVVTSLALIAPKRGKFNVTTKGANIESVQFDWRHAAPLLAIGVAIIAAFVMVPFKVVNAPLDVDTILIAAAWNGYNFVVLTAASLAALERPQRRTHHRVNRVVQVTVSAAEPEGEAWFAPLEGNTFDLSLGGCALQIPGNHDLPSLALATFRSPYGATTMEIAPIAVEYDSAGDRTLVRGSFEGLTAAKEAELSAHIFSASNAWVNEEYRYDGYLRSAIGVLVAIVSVGLGNPGWLRRYSAPTKDNQMAKLVPGAAEHNCYSCGAPMLVGSTECEVCGALQPVEPRPRFTDGPKSRPEDRSWAEMILPAVLILLSVTLWAGYRPVVEAFADVVPMQRWEKVTHQTRLGMLTQAYFRIEALEHELERAVARDKPLDESWGRRLWEVGRDYKLMDEKVSREDTASVEVALQDAVSAMDRARRLYKPGTADSESVTNALNAARDHVERAGDTLKIPRKDRR